MAPSFAGSLETSASLLHLRRRGLDPRKALVGLTMAFGRGVTLVPLRLRERPLCLGAGRDLGFSKTARRLGPCSHEDLR